MHTQQNYSELIDKKFFFRTITGHFLGKVVGLLGDFLELEQANEAELTGTCFVNINTIVSFFPWEH